MKTRNIAVRIAVFLIGLVFVAIGINISKIAGLGIAPVTSLARTLELITGLTLGTTTIFVYCAMVFTQFLMKRKNFEIINILGIPLALAFGVLVDLVGIDPKAVGHLLVNLPRPQGYFMQLLYLAISIILIGFGDFLYLEADLVLMPAEGLSYAITDKTGKPFGDVKTVFDVGMVVISVTLTLIFLGGIKSFADPAKTVIREGTLLSAIFIGQTIKMFRNIFKKKKIL